MDLLSILLVLIVVGVILYAINAFLPIQSQILKLINIVTIVVLVWWLLKIFGVWQRFQHLRF